MVIVKNIFFHSKKLDKVINTRTQRLPICTTLCSYTNPDLVLKMYHGITQYEVSHQTHTDLYTLRHEYEKSVLF